MFTQTYFRRTSVNTTESTSIGMHSIAVWLLSRVRLCNPMSCSRPDFPVLPYLPEFAQTHVHLVSDVIQPSYPLSPHSPPALQLFPASVFSNESALHIRWPKYWSFSISPSSRYSRMISFRIYLISLLFKGLSRVFSSTTVQNHQFFSIQPSLWFNFHICTWLLEKP